MLPVSCLGLDLDASYQEVLEAMRAIAPVDEREAEFPSVSAYPDLGPVLWAGVKPGELAAVRVESVLVKAPKSVVDAPQART